MRFRLLLEVNKRAFGNLLPINYQYEQSALIYRILSRASEEYSKWLHENGFRLDEKKTFKLFTYSRLKIEKRHIIAEAERIAVLSDVVEWQISFFPEKSTEKFIQGIFANQVFEIGDKKSTVQFKVRSIEAMPSPDFKEEMEFVTMSPMCLRVKNEGYKEDYISPADERAKNVIYRGLLERYEAYYGEKPICEVDFNFELTSEPKSVLVKIKSDTKDQTKMRGYMCSFKMKADPILMKIMYESGIGGLGSQGFGCVRLK